MKRLLAVLICAIPVAIPVIATAQIPAPTGSSATQTVPTAIAHAKKSNRIKINANAAMRINYGDPGWNKSASTIDTAVVIMREGVTGQIVQIQLDETAPDSSLFSGRYSITFKNIEKMQTEFYIPSQDQLKTKDGLIKLTGQISSGAVGRNPFILRKLPTGEQSVEIFDTKEQARQAMNAYKTEQLVTMQNQKSLVNAGVQPSQFPSDQDLAAQRLAEEAKERAAAAAAASERARVQQLEAKRLQNLIAQQAALSVAAKAEQRKRAARLAAEGAKLYEAEDFEGARKKFDQAVELDSDNREFYFQYGVTLYKTSDFNRALVMFRLADGDPANRTERAYFTGLSYFKIKETDSALAAFDKVVATKEPTMAPSAQFYRGVIYFERASWDKSRAAFQEVLDSSSDPKLDERAESYIEQILMAQRYEAERNQKWTFSATFGEMYDSNILLISNSLRDSGTATDEAGFRSLFAGSARYRSLYEETYELATQLDLVTMFTVTDGLEVTDSLRNLDPTIVTLSVPWTHKGTLFGKGHKLELTPGFESTFMSIDDNKTKAIINSGLLGFSNLFVMHDKWFSTVTLGLRSDDSKLNGSVGDDDSSAVNVSLSNSNVILSSRYKDHMLLVDGGLTQNSAKGKNLTFNRFDLGVGYLMPWKWESVANLKLGYFYIDYPQALLARTDHSLTLTTGLSRKINDIWSGGFTASYNVNNSNQDANAYDKLTALLTLSAAYGL